MDELEWLAERFEKQRARLRAVAYRMLGSLTEAEDAVQDTWLRLCRSDPDAVDNLGGWLTTVVARVCLNMLRTRGRRREDPLDPRVPSRPARPGTRSPRRPPRAPPWRRCWGSAPRPRQGRTRSGRRRPVPSRPPRPARPRRRRRTRRAPPPVTTRSTPVCPAAKALGVAGGEPIVSPNPDTLTTPLLSLSGLSFDGVASLRTTGGGTLRCLQFSMDSSSLTPFREESTDAGHTTVETSSKLTISGSVRIFMTEIKGSLFGLLPVDFTPDSPPLLVVPDLFFTDATVKLAYVRADRTTVPDLTVSFEH